MKIYLVGGAVRDALMGSQDSDKDWVVVGATPEDLIFEGYTPVGKDFPVFLHPHTGEEYALARTERKTAPGYHGFVFHADPSITLEEDLARRDLTMNAIAKDANGQLIDPFNGQEDIKNQVFRHVSQAFKEDPVRILRLARFAAKYPEFSVAPETEALLKEMCEEGEVDALVSERVWQELSKGLMCPSPYRMLEVLIKCGALQRLFPQINETDLERAHLMSVKLSLDKVVAAQAPLSVRFAVLDFLLPVADQLKAPKECTELAELLSSFCGPLLTSDHLSAKELLSLLQACDALRRPERFMELLSACECLSQSEGDQPFGLKAFLIRMQQTALAVDHKEVAAAAIKEGLVAAQIGDAIDAARVKAITQALTQTLA